MAGDKQVNVNINYRVNTIEIQKGEAAVKQADQATEKLRQSTNQFNTQSTQGYKFTSKAIEGMENELARLRQQIKLTSTADTQRLQQLSAQYKNAKAQLDAYNKSLFETSKATNAAAIGSKDLAQQISGVYAAARAFIAAGIVRELINMELAAAKLSGKVEGVETAFARLPNSVLILKSLQDATKGTVTDLELMQKAKFPSGVPKLMLKPVECSAVSFQRSRPISFSRRSVSLNK